MGKAGCWRGCWMVRGGEEVGILRGRGAKSFFFSWKSWGASAPRLKSRHNYSISMLSCASVFLYSSNLSQPTRHIRPSEKKPVRDLLCHQPSASLPSPSHWLSAVDRSQRKARGIMGAASALVGLWSTKSAETINRHWRMKPNFWWMSSFKKRENNVLFWKSFGIVWGVYLTSSDHRYDMTRKTICRIVVCIKEHTKLPL